jgi:hypothetical protein
VIKKSFSACEECIWIDDPKGYCVEKNWKPFFLFHQDSFNMGKTNQNSYQIKHGFHNASDFVESHVIDEI